MYNLTKKGVEFNFNNKYKRAIVTLKAKLVTIPILVKIYYNLANR